ncbi:MAG: peroxiredoxin family protein [Verrucomicrobiota bacterium]|nr:peroxiredoxin family protein [Verrucomicrobiota bacterium]
MMKKAAGFFFLIACVAGAAVVRPAPNFTFEGPRSLSSLRALRGQPVVLIVARSPRDGAVRKQAARLREVYQQFAAHKVVFIAAFVRDSGPVASDIPFVIAPNGEEIAAAYDVHEPFNVIIIGRDGNIDAQTSKVLPASRVRDVIQNSFEEQTARRK